jgi:hypothetical protein
LGDDRVSGDTLSLASGSASFANKDAGSAKAVSVGGITLGGADAADYLLANSSASTTATINRAALTVTANTLSKVYGDSLNLNGSEFATLGLVAGETIGQVTLASSGSASSASVVGGPYALNASAASGGTFDPLNYNLSYQSGLIRVTPRPVTVAGNTVVRFAEDTAATNPGGFNFTTTITGQLAGDGISSSLAAPAGSNTALGGAVYALVPSTAVFATGTDASNYTLRYSNGLLVVLPTPLRPGETDAGNSGGGGTSGFALGDIKPEDVARAQEALARVAAAVAQPESDRAYASAGAAPAVRGSDLAATELSEALVGDSRRVTMPALLRLPLISLDPQLRRVILGTDAAPAARP